MKKYFMLAIMAIVTLGVISCGDEDETTNGNQSGSAISFEGSWSVNFPHIFSKAVFTTTDFEFSNLGEKTNGRYIVSNGKVSFSPSKYYIYDSDTESWVDLTSSDNTTPYDADALLLCNSKVLVLKYDDYYFDMYFKDNEVIHSLSSEIQGKWLWYDSEKKNVEASLTINGDTFDMIATSDRQRAQGTFIYENGILTLNVTKYFTREYFEGQKSVSNLEKDWNEVGLSAVSRPLFYVGYNFPFMASSSEAFAYIEGEHAHFVK